MRRWKKTLLALVALLVVLGGLLAWRLHTWGQPLPAAYELISVSPADAEGGRSYTYQRTRAGREASPDPPRRIVSVDTDGDGTIDVILAGGAPLRSYARPQPQDPEARWLIVCLDGVPYAEMRALWEEGHFREFFRPVPLISPFPSDSETALTDVFHAGPVPGYEHRYFDRSANRLRGGTLATLTEVNIPYLALLDYDMGGLFKGLAYVLPRKSYRADLGRLRQRFLASPQKSYLAHIASSDSLYHILPRPEMRRLLLEVEALLRELYLDAQGKLRITLFSDHGNSLVRSQPVSLETHLEAHGWRLASSLRGSRTVVVPAYGLVGFLAVHCAPAERAALAAALAQVEGVDLGVYAAEAGVIIESDRGRAHLEWLEDGSAFRYEPRSGDPLALSEILAKLKQEGKVNTEGWVADADLSPATQEHIYPDVADRLRQWATNHVANRADILVSLRPGYFHGSGLFRHLVDLLSTHGALDHRQTLGFAMSTDGPLPGPVRSRDLLPGNWAKGGSSTSPGD